MFSRVLLMFLAFSISVLCSSRTLAQSPDNHLTKIYTVYVDLGLYHNDCSQYQLLLKKVLQQRSPKDALVYCYKEVSGFAAKLTHEEAEKLKSEKGIVGVVEPKIYSIDVEPNSYRFPNDINN